MRSEFADDDIDDDDDEVEDSVTSIRSDDSNSQP